MIRHTVLFRFRNPADAVEAKAKLDALVGRVPSIASLWCGVTTGSATDTHHLALITDHADADELAAYQADPIHLEASGWIRERISDKSVVDAVLED